MAPNTQAAPTRRAPAPPQAGRVPDLTQQDRMDNDDAPIGAEEDGALGRGDTRLPNQGQSRTPADDGLTRREQVRRSPHDDARSDIAARFRRTTPENERPFNGDLNDNENLLGEVAREDDEMEQEAIRRAQLAESGLDPDVLGDEEDPTGVARGQQQAPAVPAKKKLKVRGVDVELTDEEILEAARKSLAGDSYLEETRRLLNEAKEIRRGRPGQDRSPTGDQTGADDLEPPLPDDATRPNEPSFKSVVEKIQFGDPEEAARELETIVDRTSTKRANEGQLQRAFNQDFTRSQKALKAFQDANPDLANDEIAAMAIESTMYKLYREDMEALGLEADQIPADKNALANYHRFYRVNGYEVRPTSALLNEARDRIVKWRGQNGQQSQTQPRKAQPRVEVNVDRDARRANIPNQPTRAAVPRRDVAPQQRPTGSEVVANMRRARGQVV